MGVLYVVHGAQLSCSCGTKESPLSVQTDRHVAIADKLVGNRRDITCSNIPTFGGCATYDYASCAHGSVYPWFRCKKDVRIAGHEALLLESFTVCPTGGGMITIVSSGQGESLNQAITQNLADLMAMIKQYGAEHHLSPKEMDKLFLSTLAWNGHEMVRHKWLDENGKPISGADSFGIKLPSDKDTNAFAEYLKDKNPYLYGFFERKVELNNNDKSKEVDLSYMAIQYLNMTVNHDTEFNLPVNVIAKYSLLNAQVDASNMRTNRSAGNSFYEDMVNYYGLDGKGDKTGTRYTQFLKPYDDAIKAGAPPLQNVDLHTLTSKLIEGRTPSNEGKKVNDAVAEILLNLYRRETEK